MLETVFYELRIRSSWQILQTFIKKGLPGIPKIALTADSLRLPVPRLHGTVRVRAVEGVETAPECSPGQRRGFRDSGR